MVPIELNIIQDRHESVAVGKYVPSPIFLHTKMIHPKCRKETSESEQVETRA